MKFRIIVDGDDVSGTDQHQVSGTRGSSPAKEILLYKFSGKVKEKDEGNDFVTIENIKIVTKGNNESPQHPHVAIEPLQPPTFKIEKFDPDEPDNNGSSNEEAGSKFVTISGAAVILDSDDFDTCNFDGSSNMGRFKKSKVTASGQDFVTVSEDKSWL